MYSRASGADLVSHRRGRLVFAEGLAARSTRMRGCAAAGGAWIGVGVDVAHSAVAGDGV